MNEIARMSDLASNLAASAESVSGGFDGAYMNFTKYGEWEFGTEKQEVEDGSEWAINPQGFAHGWVAWGTKELGTDGEKLGEVMVPATDPLPARESLPEVKGRWSEQIGIQMVCLSGLDEGVKVLYNANSVGGKKAYRDIVQKVVQRINSGDDAVVPVVGLFNSHYQHKKFGKIFNPVIKVSGFITLDELFDRVAPTPAANVGNTKAEAAEPAPEEVVETEAEAPAEEEPRARRRRRRS